MHDRIAGRRFPNPIPEPHCDACGKEGISYRLTLTSVLRPAAQRHKFFCVTCWLALRAQLDGQGATSEQ